MKLLIIEGPDRCGKDTLITNLVSQTGACVVTHFGKAEGENDEEKRKNQQDFFHLQFNLAKKSQRESFHMPGEEHEKDLFIWNRSHLGEFVYGTLYRNTHPEEWVLQLESHYKMDEDDEVYLLLLTAHPEFLCKRDDGLSFSSKVEDKIQEIEKFKEAFLKSSITNKLHISVSYQDSNGETSFKPKEDILKQVNNFLWQKK